MKRLFKDKQIGLNIAFIILCALVIYPLLMVVAVSLSSEADVAKYGYLLIPKKIDLSAYQFVFKNPQRVIDAYKVTIIFSIANTFLSVLAGSMAAFSLTTKAFKQRRFVNFYFYFTTLFSGGMVPHYILNTRYLHLDNTIWIYIIPSIISVWHLFMMRANFKELPEEMFEAVKIDGGSQYTIFFKFVLPLSKPVLATVALITFLSKWNDWSTSMLYTSNSRLFSLQYLLQDIMENINFLQNSAMMGSGAGMLSLEAVPTETVRMAMAIVVAGPALVIFPFFQKYFVKGLTVGSVKG